jgi:ferredoxin
MMACVDKEVCIGCGSCASIAQDIFEMEDDGLEGAAGQVAASNEAEAKDAEASYPARAIKVK